MDYDICRSYNPFVLCLRSCIIAMSAGPADTESFEPGVFARIIASTTLPHDRSGRSRALKS